MIKGNISPFSVKDTYAHVCMIQGNISPFSVTVNSQKVNELTYACGQVGFKDNAGTLRAAYVQHILTVNFRTPRTLNRPSRVGWRGGGG